LVVELVIDELEDRVAALSEAVDARDGLEERETAPAA
jgi:hypothetical protein